MEGTSREVCKLCYHVNGVGFLVPDDVWRAIVPRHVQREVVCLPCFTRLGDEKGVPWDGQIAFFPVSLATHLTPARGRRNVKNTPAAFCVRIPVTMHAALVAEAREEGVSLNSLVVCKLCLLLGTKCEPLKVNATEDTF